MTGDDALIPDRTRLFRRVHPDQVIWDGNEGRLRPTSGAFRGHEMSVNLGSVMAAAGQLAGHAVRNYPRHHLVALSAGLVRAEEQTIRPDPQEHDDSHGNVVGDKPKARRNLFALRATWSVLRREELSAENAAYEGGVTIDDALAEP